jgi:hypothetical protein
LLRGELKRVAVAARNEDSAPSPFFFCGSGGEKIIRLEARRLRVLKAACGNKVREHLKLFNHGVVELSSALVSRKVLMPVSGCFQRVPGDKHRARLLFPVEA